MKNVVYGFENYDDRGNQFYRQAPKETAKKVKVITLASGQQIVWMKPYIIPNVRNGRKIKNRPIIWIESAFEADNQMAVSVALNFINKLLNCKGRYCIYDYVFVPIVVGADAIQYNALNDSSWLKTLPAPGVNLLANFDYGNWSTGDSNPSSQQYRGPSVMSSPRTQYQTMKNAVEEDIRLSVTFSSSGKKLGYPFAYKTTPPSGKCGNTTIEVCYINMLEEYRKAVQKVNNTVNYDVGTYGSVNGIATGHPLDYNFNQYKNGMSFNVALRDVKNNFLIMDNVKEFYAGLSAVIDYLRKKDSWPV